MYKNFRVGGGIVLGLSALVLGLVGCSTATFRNSDNNIKKADNFSVGNSTYTLCKGLEELNASDSYVISVQYNETEYFMCDYNTKGYKTVEWDKKTENENVSTIKFIGSGSSYKIKNNEKFLSVLASKGLGNVYEDSATVWTVEYKDNYFNFTATDSKNAKRYVAYNNDSKEIRGYTTPSDTAVITFNVYKYSIDESNPALNLETNTEVSFKYKYISEESEAILTGVSKNGTLSKEEANGGKFNYKLATSNYANSNLYTNKMDANGYFIEYSFSNPVSNASITFSFKVFKTLNSSFDVYCYENDSDDSIIGSVIKGEKLTYAQNKVIKDYKIVIPEEYTNIGRIKLLYNSTSGNVGVGAVNFSGNSSINAKTITNISNFKVNIGFTDSLIEGQTTGLIVTAKNNFTLPSDSSLSFLPYVHISNNTKKVEDFYISINITDIIKYKNTEIYYAPFVIKDDVTYYGNLESTSIVKEVSKISDIALKQSILTYLGE